MWKLCHPDKPVSRVDWRGAIPLQEPLTASVMGRAAGSSSQLPSSGENSPVSLQK